MVCAAILRDAFASHAYAERDIISARKATKREGVHYEQGV
jgi:uncharacterized DUF497 family protein